MIRPVLAAIKTIYAVLCISVLPLSATAASKPSPFLMVVEICAADNLSFDGRLQALMQNGWMAVNNEQLESAIVLVGDAALFARYVPLESMEAARVSARSEIRQKIVKSGDSHHRSALLAHSDFSGTILLLHSETIGDDSISCEVGTANPPVFFDNGKLLLEFAGSDGLFRMHHSFAAQQLPSHFGGKFSNRHTRIAAVARKSAVKNALIPYTGTAFLGLYVKESSGS